MLYCTWDVSYLLRGRKSTFRRHYGIRSSILHRDISYPFYSELTLTYLLHAAVFLEKLTGLQLVKKFPAFYGTRRFITALTSARHLSLSWTSSIQSIPPHPTSWRSILMLSSHLRMDLPSGLFPSGFLTKNLYTPLFSPISATCSAHIILLYFITRTILGEEYRSFSCSICSFLHSPVTSSLLGKYLRSDISD